MATATMSEVAQARKPGRRGVNLLPYLLIAPAVLFLALFFLVPLVQTIILSLTPGGEFNKVFTDTFQRIVLRGEPIRATLDNEATAMRDIIASTKAPCWAPDTPSDGPCPVK